MQRSLNNVNAISNLFSFNFSNHFILALPSKGNQILCEWWRSGRCLRGGARCHVVLDGNGGNGNCSYHGSMEREEVSTSGRTSLAVQNSMERETLDATTIEMLLAMALVWSRRWSISCAEGEGNGAGGLRSATAPLMHWHGGSGDAVWRRRLCCSNAKASMEEEEVQTLVLRGKEIAQLAQALMDRRYVRSNL